nr:protein phosphatase 1 regulatory subunit 12B-like [Leptinotarsa decemlineata]
MYNKQPVTPTRHRSSSSARSTGSSYNNRPRSLGHYTSPYSSPYSNSTNPYSSFGNYNGYGSNYQSPYFPNGYRGSTTSSGGYASLKIPAKALLNLATSSYAKKYDSGNDGTNGSHVSRRDLSRGGSYRERSVSRSRSSLPSSGMGSKSISLTSLNSEGYVSGTDRSSRSRISSTSDIRNENGEIDYKKLYEQQLVENERLKDKLRKSDEELRETKQTLEKINLVTSKNSLSELEKRERRAMERKLSEMEEELKNLDNLRTENQRLKDENGALIRVISKLSK